MLAKGGDPTSNNTKPAITFEAQVAKVQTLADGGLRVVFDLPETAIPQASMLMECQCSMIPLLLTAVANDKGAKDTDTGADTGE